MPSWGVSACKCGVAVDLFENALGEDHLRERCAEDLDDLGATAHMRAYPVLASDAELLPPLVADEVQQVRVAAARLMSADPGSGPQTRQSTEPRWSLATSPQASWRAHAPSDSCLQLVACPNLKCPRHDRPNRRAHSP